MTLASRLEAARRDVDAELDRLLPPAGARPARLHEAMRYALFAGGKRVRPALALLSAEALGVPRATALPGAAALEAIHTYSLVHDDLPALDDDDLRRGRPTVHKAFDEATAILVGDALLTFGLGVLARRPDAAPPGTRARACALVAEAIGSLGMIGGQMDDLEAERRWPDDPAAALESIHRRKTGALLEVSLRLPGVYAGVSAGEDARLSRLGAAVGLLFQIADDVLDVEGSAEVLGKTAGKDAAARKLTYPGLFGLAAAKARLAEVAAEASELASALPGADLFRDLVRYVAERDR